MPRKCCVPGCSANYRNESYTPAFLFPKNEERKNLWLSAINRKDFKPGSCAVVCIVHFDERFVIKDDKIPQKDGSVLTVPRKKCMLTEDAYPTIFPNQPHYLSKPLAEPRKSPSKRREALQQRDEENFIKWCEADIIKTLDDIKFAVPNKVSDPYMYKLTDSCIYIYKMEIFQCPEVTVVLEILENLTVRLYYKKQPLDSKSILGFVLGKEQKLDRWTKFESVLSFLNSFELKEMTLSQKISSIMLILNDIIDNDEIEPSKIMFIKDQLSLATSKQHRYSAEMILWCTHLYFSYPAAYMMIRKSGIMTLPHQSYLRNLASFLNLSGENDFVNNHSKYLKQKANSLKEHEKIVNLLIDEIYINPSIDYKGGNVVGIADNSDETFAASTVQAFLISSLFSKNKDIVALVPVKNLTSDQLHNYTIKVMDLLHSCHYTVLSLISDNNRINRNMFTTMCNGNLTSSIESPYDSTKRIFFLFDTPHLIKSIRNNWLNQSLTNQTFFYPDPADMSKISIASVSHLKQIYDLEKHLTIKTAPKLTRKVLFPSAIERQNVNHALCLFHDTTIASLEHNSSKFGSEFKKTKLFIEHIQRWWKIVNCKHPYKGKHMRDPYCDPISNRNHANINFLEQFCEWIIKWKELADSSAVEKSILSVPEKGGMLLKETQFALLHSTRALIDMSFYVLDTLQSNYVLLGKFQTDSLEACFGQYRQMNGGNYNISFRQVIESDKKLKILSLLKLYSTCAGEFCIKSLDCSDTTKETAVSKNYEEFADVIHLSNSVNIPEPTESVLIFIAGYVAYKVQSRIECSDCIAMLLSNDALQCDFLSEEVTRYMQEIDRGGLKWPKQFTVNIIFTAFSVFQVLISENYEGMFLKNICLKDIVMTLTMKKIILNNSIYLNMCSCGISSDILIKKCLSVMANILLNNYCKAKNDSLHTNKGSKRKLSTLLALTSK